MATLRQIQETLSQSNGAQFLYQPVIDRALFEATRKFTATRALFPRKAWNTPTYIFNKRTNYPQTRAVVEAPPTTGTGSVAATASTYSQVSWAIKHWQNNLDLAKFSIQTARVNGDLMQLELEAATESAMWFEEAVNLYGSAGATNGTYRPEWDGVDLLMSANSTNKIAVNSTPSIAMLDAMIDAVKKSLGAVPRPNQYAMVMSSEMLSAIGRLFVQEKRYLDKAVIYPRDDRGQLNGQITDNRSYIDGGLELVSYRGVPFVESSFVTSLGQMGTVTATDGGSVSGGSLVNSQYGYIIEAVSDYGVTLASAEATVTPTAGHQVSLSWSTPTVTDANGNSRQILMYRIFRTAAAGASNSETLYAVVSALDNNDAAVTSWNDTGLPVLPYASGASGQALYSVTVATSSTNAAPDGVTLPRVNVGSHTAQDIWMLPRDPDILLVPVVNELQTVQLALVNARTQQVALEGDQVLVVRGPGFMAKAMSVYLS
ncbi:MAG TPA: hypothetical protein VFN23_10515 [Ktedonobacteraceae bacterium]|nr:hypothetical protein [Ktedonobacteraceae bacterium]